MPIEYVLILLVGSLILYGLVAALWPQHILYIFIGTWLIYPNAGQSVIGIEGIPVFAFVELFGAICIFLIALRTKNTPPVRSGEGAFIALLALTVLIQFAVFSPIVGTLYAPMPGTADYVRSILPEVSAVLFLYGAYKLVRNIDDAMPIFRLFTWFSVLLVGEYFLVGFVPFIKTLLGSYSFSPFGKFDSIFLNHFGAVGFVGGVGAICALYLFRTTDRKIYLACFAASALLPFLSTQRTYMAAFAAGLFVYWIFGMYRQKWVSAVLGGAVLATLLLAAESILPTIASWFSDEYLARRALNVLSSDSLSARIGTQAKVLEVVERIFPLGVGNNMLPHYVDLPTDPLFSPTDSKILSGYYRVSESRVPTLSHNGYIEQVASYGLVGLISLLTFVGLAARNIATARVLRDVRDPGYQSYIATCAILVFTAVFYFFAATPKVYIVVFIAFHMTFVWRGHTLRRETTACA